MVKWHVFGILLLAAMICAAGCTGFSGEEDTGAITPDAGVNITPTTPVTIPNGGEEGDTVYIDGAADDMKAVNIYAEAYDWDAEPGNDGIVVHFKFLDEQGRTIRFANEFIKAEVLIYSADKDVTGQDISPRKVLFKGYATISSWEEGGPNLESGIRVAYSDIAFTSKDPGIGKVVFKATLPAGRILQDDIVYLYAV
jgi:preprotein translocase subunit Sec61beta